MSVEVAKHAHDSAMNESATHCAVQKSTVRAALHGFTEAAPARRLNKSQHKEQPAGCTMLLEALKRRNIAA